MTGRLARLAISALMGAACTATAVHATSNHTYEKNEYAVIRDGTAPNRQYSVAAHGNGEAGYDDFHLYLMAEPGHRKIGPLEEVGLDILDTGPDAYGAAWSTDSRHVALFYRTDRHILAMRLYRIQNRRAYPITGETLFRAVTSHDAESSDDQELRSSSTRLTWSGPGRFTLQEQRLFRTNTPDLARALGRFGKPQAPDADNPASSFVDFSAEAECELIDGNRFRILNVKPGRFAE